MGLNPSCNSVDPKLALPVVGDGPWKRDLAEQIKQELTSALPEDDSLLLLWEEKEEERSIYKEGTEAWKLARSGIHFPGMAKPEDTEQVTLVSMEGTLYGWRFCRAWYYWICSTSSGRFSIPKPEADAFNDEWGTEIRADGYAGGHTPFRDVSTYHVDTSRGLEVLLKLLKDKFGQSAPEEG